MFWQEDDEFVLNDDVVDVLFDLKGKTLPVDHAHALSAALSEHLPWFAEQENAGLHLIYIGSGNGWESPDARDGGEMHISRRTKLILRLPKHRVEETAGILNGVQIDVDGHQLTLGKAKIKSLSTLTTLNSRYVIADPEHSEEAFSQYVVDELRAMGIRIKRLLCGKSTVFKTPQGDVLVRSVMLADLAVEDAVLLQKKGVGPGRHMGCGLFIAHKGINAVSMTQKNDGE